MRIFLSLLRTENSPVLAQRLPYVLLCVVLSAIGTRVAAQPIVNAQQGANAQNALIAPAGNNNGAVLFGGANATGNGTQQGGGANADFESLIDLIVSTVATETWAENGGGEAEIRPFPTGVLVDAAGTLRLKSLVAAGGANDLSVVRGDAPAQSLKRPRQERTRGGRVRCGTCRCRDWSGRLRVGRRRTSGWMHRC
jgi:hypothetical protein